MRHEHEMRVSFNFWNGFRMLRLAVGAFVIFLAAEICYRLLRGDSVSVGEYATLLGAFAFGAILANFAMVFWETLGSSRSYQSRRSQNDRVDRDSAPSRPPPLESP